MWGRTSTHVINIVHTYFWAGELTLLNKKEIGFFFHYKWKLGFKVSINI